MPGLPARATAYQTRAGDRAAATVAEGLHRMADAREALSPYVGSNR